MNVSLSSTGRWNNFKRRIITKQHTNDLFKNVFRDTFFFAKHRTTWIGEQSFDIDERLSCVFFIANELTTSLQYSDEIVKQT